MHSGLRDLVRGVLQQLEVYSEADAMSRAFIASVNMNFCPLESMEHGVNLSLNFGTHALV